MEYDMDYNVDYEYGILYWKMIQNTILYTEYYTWTKYGHECLWWQYPILIATTWAVRGGFSNSNFQKQLINSWTNWENQLELLSTQKTS